MEALKLSFLKVLSLGGEKRVRMLTAIVDWTLPCFNGSQVEDGDMSGHDLTHDAAENEVECCANCQRDAGWEPYR